MTNAGVVVDHAPVEVQKEKIGGQSIRKGGTVISLELFVPVSQCKMIGEGQRDLVDSLEHLNEFMSIGSDGSQVVHLGEVHVGSTDHVVGLFSKTLDGQTFKLSGKTTSAAELSELEVVLAILESLDLSIQTLLGGSQKFIVVVLKSEVYFVYDLQKIDLKLHGAEKRSADDDGELAVIEICMYVISQRMPETKEFHVVGFDEADASQIIQLLVIKGQSAKMIDLSVDFFKHLLGEYYAFVSAFEVIFSVKICVFVKDDLVHVELVKVCVKK